MKIKNFSNYEFLEDGKIFSYNTNKYLKSRIDSFGYLIVQCVDDSGKKITRTLNNWICRAFYGEPPSEDYEAMHLDEDKMNCRKENLRWGTHKENINYGNRTQKNAIAHYKKIHQYSINNVYINTFASIKEASEATDTSYEGIIKCAKGKIKTSGGYIWKYAD